MILNKLKISGLFEQFNYTISFKNEEKLTIITGPNGYGKTMILNIIYNFFNRRFYFFQNLVFKKIELFLEDDITIEITKKKEKDKIKKHTLNLATSEVKEIIEEEEKEREKVLIRFLQNKEELDSFLYSNEVENEFWNRIDRYIPVQRISPSQWIDRRTNRLLSMDEIINEFANQLPEELLTTNSRLNLKNEKVINLFKTANVHLIKEQRLLRQSLKKYSEKETVLTNTIQEYADELKDLVRNTQSQSFRISQELDSTFPKRLLEEKGKITEKDFNNRYKVLIDKQEKLKKYGLSASKQEVLSQYNKDDAKALLVYLNDTDKKTKVFDELLERIELFTNILNERRFSFKEIQIDPSKGFTFLTNKQKPLNLKDLSSGEQHEVVLLYELIFKAKPNTMVLIDEPEISLHVAWQTEFLDDIMQIIKLQNIPVIIATHSPQIINENWDLTINLENQVQL
jgi:predicted ATP-binding protein involved in virulence